MRTSWAIENELQKFEKWVTRVQPLLTDPSYQPTYEELRLAIRILGIRVTVFPSTGDWPFRYDVIATVPEIINKLAFLSQTSRRL